jgi:hypothetical protein
VQQQQHRAQRREQQQHQQQNQQSLHLRASNQLRARLREVNPNHNWHPNHTAGTGRGIHTLLSSGRGRSRGVDGQRRLVTTTTTMPNTGARGGAAAAAAAAAAPNSLTHRYLHTASSGNQIVDMVMFVCVCMWCMPP